MVTTALSHYMLPYEASGPGLVNSVMGIPIVVSPYAPKDTAYLFKNEIVTDHIDTLLMSVLLSDVRTQARNIVRRKIKEKCPWLNL